VKKSHRIDIQPRWSEEEADDGIFDVLGRILARITLGCRSGSRKSPTRTGTARKRPTRRGH
jgi:hypothetical protein